MSDQPPLCEDCATVMADAGAIGFYCTNDFCPGRAKSLAWAREQVERDNPSPATLAALRADAERYRWLKAHDGGWMLRTICFGQSFDACKLSGETDLEKIIDTAMADTKPGPAA